jgi:hypothetical protein
MSSQVLSREYIGSYRSQLESLEMLPKDLHHLVTSYSDPTIWEACEKLMVHLQTHCAVCKKGAWAPLFQLEKRQTALWICLHNNKGERLWEKKIGTKKSGSQIKGSVLFGDLFGTVKVKVSNFYHGSHFIIFRSGLWEYEKSC